MLSLDSAREVALLLPKDGRMHVLEALRDPSSRDAVIKLLQSENPPEALARQAERDVAEAVTPMGRPIIFKSVARSLAPRLIRVADALANALPHKDTQAGNASLAIALASEDPEAEFLELYQEVALDAFGSGATPALSGEEWLEEYYGHDPQMAGLLKSLKKVFKKIGSAAKKVAKKIPWRPIALIGATVVGTAATVLTGGAAAPLAFTGVKMLAGSIGGQTSGVIQNMFGATEKIASIGAQVASAVTSSGLLPGSSSGLSTALSTFTKVAETVTQPKAPPVTVQPYAAQPYIAPMISPQAFPSATTSSGGGSTTPVYTASTTPMSAEEIEKKAKELLASQATPSAVPPWAWVAGGVAAFGVLAYVTSDRESHVAHRARSNGGRRARRSPR